MMTLTLRFAFLSSYKKKFNFLPSTHFLLSIKLIESLFLYVYDLHNQDLLEGSCDPICSVDEPSSSYFEANYQPKTDIVKAVAILAAALTGTAAINHSWVAANQVLLASSFCVSFGYAYL